ncbi:MAG: YeeE/YedE thiosulfate transporter family protein, partial [Gaiellales bacterium]
MEDGIGFGRDRARERGAGLAVLVARSRTGLVPGLGLGVVGAVAWVVADWVGYGYGLGFVGTATSVKHAIDVGRVGALSFEVYLAVGVVAGAALDGGADIRLPSP